MLIYTDALGGPSTGEELNNGVVINNEPEMTFLDHVDAEYDRSQSTLDATMMSPSRSGVTPDMEDLGHKAPSDAMHATASEGGLIGDQLSSNPTDNLVEVLSPEKVAPDRTYQEESPGRPEVIDAESKEFQEPKDTEAQNSFNGEEITSMEKSVLQPCNSHAMEPDRSSLEGDQLVVLVYCYAYKNAKNIGSTLFFWTSHDIHCIENYLVNFL